MTPFICPNGTTNADITTVDRYTDGAIPKTKLVVSLFTLPFLKSRSYVTGFNFLMKQPGDKVGEGFLLKR